MLHLTEFFIILFLILIFVQDVKARAVYWLCFPLLASCCLLYSFLKLPAILDIGWALLLNNVFIFLQLLAVSIWLSLRQKKWINITHRFLGWGDILFFCCIACCFSPANFILFYISSLITVLFIWLSGKRLLFRRQESIPLAGLQAVCLALVLSISWRWPVIDLRSDQWLMFMIQS